MERSKRCTMKNDDKNWRNSYEHDENGSRQKRQDCLLVRDVAHLDCGERNSRS